MNCRIQLNPDAPTLQVHADCLKPYHGPIPAPWRNHPLDDSGSPTSESDRSESPSAGDSDSSREESCLDQVADQAADQVADQAADPAVDPAEVLGNGYQTGIRTEEPDPVGTRRPERKRQPPDRLDL